MPADSKEAILNSTAIIEVFWGLNTPPAGIIPVVGGIRYQALISLPSTHWVERLSRLKTRCPGTHSRE